MAITSLYSNSIDITDRTLAAQRAAHTEREQAAFRDWLCGMNCYMDGEPVAACTTEQQRRGYESAGKADAQFSAASLPQHDCPDQGPSIEDDARFLAYEF